jgi:hypothetical protein
MRAFGLGRRKTPPAGPPRYRNPFDAVPLVPATVSIVEQAGAGEGLLLRRRLDPRTRLGAAVSRWLRYERCVHVKLDRNGALFWGLIDGRRDLGEIAHHVAEGLALPLEQARQSTLVYVKDLMLRHFIHLQVERTAAR